jgi:oligopeptide/dipeptide ABC transporter ATP-binding protein
MGILRAEGLKKHFSIKKGFFAGGASVLKAVDGVGFDVEANSVFAIVGESGCGKSTVARLLLRLLEPTEGAVEFDQKDVLKLSGAELKAYRRGVQIIFQDPFASLNPRMSVFGALSEPLKVHGIVLRRQYRDRVAELLSDVGLSPDAMSRYPHEFSGGQRQRICIARALALSPRVIVADEPLSSLDVSIQAQILNLLIELKRKTAMSFVFISHDLNVVRYFSDTVAVMYLGRIVEQAGAGEFFDNPMHPYSRMLLDSVPKLPQRGTGTGATGAGATGAGAMEAEDAQAGREGREGVPAQARTQAVEIPENGGTDVPSPINVPPGCPFHPRCARRFEPCNREIPELKNVGGRMLSCHLYGL